MSMIKDIKRYLTDGGITETIYLGNMPHDKDNKPTECIALFRYAGQSPLLKADLERPGLQVRVRSSDYETAIELIEKVSRVLRGLGDEINGTGRAVIINDTLYHRIIQVQSAQSLGWDHDTKMIDIVQNFYVTKEI